MTKASQDSYIPGVCNINREEIAYRKKTGYFGVTLYLIVFGALLALGLSRWYRLSLFIPSFIAAIGFLQAKHHFCVSYAASGQQNAIPGSHSATTVGDAAAIKQDKQRARQINLQALYIALALTAIALAVPNFK